ncbi:hypothetical protein GCM10010406_21330 [Streptomyces thermolineatus]|uniref:Uncharacterized protein n=1 Tax=Streptomyces thermolineatus TaxID=44033 RepID=A0ABN3LIQ0_9ACTN
MSLLALFTRRPAKTPTPQATPAPAPEPIDPRVIAQFSTVGGATVDLRTTTFTTLYDYRGAPYLAPESYQVDGFNWTCHGCHTVGRTRSHSDAGYRNKQTARDDANTHAGACRSMPRPTA